MGRGRVLEPFRQTGLPMLWQVGPTSSPATLPAALVENVVTVAPARRAGIATAIVHACLVLDRDRGLGRAALTSSPDGHGIYRRLGSRDCCTVSQYRFPPAS